MVNTVWIDLGCPAREMEYARYFQEAGCQILFFRMPANGIGRVIKIIAMHRLAMERMTPDSRGGRDLLLVSLRISESLLVKDYLAEFMRVNSRNEYILSVYEHSLPLASFFSLRIAVILPADSPEEIWRRWGCER
jgi:hypothetical protein